MKRFEYFWAPIFFVVFIEKTFCILPKFPPISKLLLLICFLHLFCHCTVEKLPPDFSIRLECYNQNNQFNQTETTIGIKWGLSYLGAALKPGQLDNAMRWENSSNFAPILVLDLAKVGFSDAAMAALNPIVQHIKNSQSYRSQNSIDLGRFVMLTLNSSHHYYAITGVYPTLNDFEQAYDFEDTAVIVFGNGESSVTPGNRIIYQTKNTIQNFQKMAFIALEGTGEMAEGNFETEAVEVFDFMPNGQLRFAIYDKNGNLKTAVPATLSTAGKPAKCIWCHESKILPNFVSAAPNFNHQMNQKRDFLDSLRYLIISDLNYQELQEHSLAELLYISMMEPTAQRLAQEWNLPLSQAQSLLQPYNTHTHHEYPQWGDLYDRNEVEHLSPILNLKIPASARESSFYEPKF